jgi:cytochrome oxidase Cu insertion factor (SCO1/SenC/PrrC family)
MAALFLPSTPTEDSSMSLINTEIKPFTADAFKNGKFIKVSDADLKGKWSVVFFYPANFTFVCPTVLEDLADNYAEFQKLGVEIYSVSTDTPSPTRPGTTPPRRSRRSSTRWSATRPARSAATSM